MGKSALDRQLEALLALKAQALAKGVAPVASAVTVAVAPVAPEPEPDHNDAPATNPRSAVLNAVFGYLDALKKLPRQLLEARYVKDMGEECPAAPRDWLIEKMTRRYQREQYTLLEGEIPESVKRNDRLFSMCKPGLFEEDEDDDNEPGREERKFDATMRAKAAVTENPFARGLAAQMFGLVQSQAGGIQYNGLVLLIKTINDRDQTWAERKAQKVFTKWVDKGWVVLV